MKMLHNYGWTPDKNILGRQDKVLALWILCNVFYYFLSSLATWRLKKTNKKTTTNKKLKQQQQTDFVVHTFSLHSFKHLWLPDMASNGNLINQAAKKNNKKLLTQSFFSKYIIVCIYMSTLIPSICIHKLYLLENYPVNIDQVH